MGHHLIIQFLNCISSVKYVTTQLHTEPPNAARAFRLGVQKRTELSRRDSFVTTVSQSSGVHPQIWSRPARWCILDSSVQVGDYRSGTPGSSPVPSYASLR